MNPIRQAREALEKQGVKEASDSHVLAVIALAAHARIENLEVPTVEDPWEHAASIVAAKIEKE